MRQTELWERLTTAVGAGYVDSWAQDHVIAELDGQTVREALKSGWDARSVWLAVYRHLELPPTFR